MRILLALALAVTSVGAGLASECSEQIKALDERFQLAAGEPASGLMVTPPTESGRATTEAGRLPPAPPARTEDNAALKGVPNTGGVVDSAPSAPVTAQQRDQIQQVLKEARNADAAGDATTCAAKLAEARRLAQGADASPSASGSSN